MKKLPFEVSSPEASKGFLHFRAEQVFKEVKEKALWIDRKNALNDSNVLITISDPQGVHTSLITGSKIEEVTGAHYVKAPEERVSTKQSRFITFASRLTKILGYGLVGILLIFAALSMTDVIKARVVLTGSMAPAINPGDILITINPKYSSPKIGDVVAYQGRTFSGASVAVFSHRIIGGSATNGFIVKGDHNPTPDVQNPKIPDILGVGIFTIPFIGKYLTKQALIFMVPIIVGLWIAFDALRDAPIEE